MTPPPPTRAERLHDALVLAAFLAGLALAVFMLVQCARVHVDAYLARTHPQEQTP